MNDLLNRSAVFLRSALQTTALAVGLCFGLALSVPASMHANAQSQPSTDKAASRSKSGAAARGSVSKQASAKKRTNAVRGKAAAKRGVQGKNRQVKAVVYAPPKPSFGQLAGLHSAQDQLALKSAVAFVVDQDTKEILFSKNEAAVLPIASLTKLMTGVIVSEAKLDMAEQITITADDVDTEKGSRSRLQVGTVLTRGELMHLSLMSSENRAAHALGRAYPGGEAAFVRAMNAKAKALGMGDTTFSEPTGLSSKNQSSARDLATLVSAAASHSTLREWSVSQGAQVPVGPVGNRLVNYVNTNRLTANPNWDILLQKTGYISEAGQCLVMQTKVAGRKLIMVFLDSVGKFSRLGDAERVRAWVETQTPATPRS